MKQKNLYVYLGNTASELELFWESMQNECEACYLIDKDNIKNVKDEDRTKCSYIDFSDMEKIQEQIHELMPISNIVICPGIDSIAAEHNAELELSELLRKVFMLTKMMYLPIMRSRDSKIWYLDFSPLCSPESVSHSALIHSYGAGLDAISKVASLELAKKKINVNLIRVTDKAYYSSITKLLNWTAKEKLYLTAQALTV